MSKTIYGNSNHLYYIENLKQDSIFFVFGTWIFCLLQEKMELERLNSILRHFLLSAVGNDSSSLVNSLDSYQKTIF